MMCNLHQTQNKFRWISFVSLVMVSLMAAMLGCKRAPGNAENQEAPVKPEANTQANTNEPAHITVQHILVGFEGSLPGKSLKRTKEESKKLAEEILAKSKDTKANFDALVKQYTDDQAPGIYGMSNKGVLPEGEEFPRDQMVPAFGDVGFKLNVGEVGLAQYDPMTSPYGFHVIKRIK